MPRHNFSAGASHIVVLLCAPELANAMFFIGDSQLNIYRLVTLGRNTDICVSFHLTP
jgi:hypothetical protein